MSEPYLGMIIIVPYNFAPRGWAFCQGQILPIAQNTALFSLLGTTFGGNGQTTFALPDLRGRYPIGSGQGPGLSSYVLGEVTGTETTTLSVNNMPAHNHQVSCIDDDGTLQLVKGNMLTNSPSNTMKIFGPPASANALMAPTIITNTGGSQPFEQMPPCLGLNYCIALEGIFPSRN